MTELEKQLKAAAGDLSADLATMHGVIFNLIVGLRNTELTRGQLPLINAAENELRKSQQKFFARYADSVGGAAPENN